VLDASGWSKEEHKMIDETRKIMGLAQLHVVPTTVRVPVRVSHSEAVYTRFSRPIDPEQARELLRHAPGVVVEDDPAMNLYPLARHAEGRDEVFVGRIRQVPGDNRALAFWVVSDNLRKGAATNAVQIAERALTLNPVWTAHHGRLLHA
jgi:aspartate-semialdehyde dehydrogenase